MAARTQSNSGGSLLGVLALGALVYLCVSALGAIGAGMESSRPAMPQIQEQPNVIMVAIPGAGTYEMDGHAYERHGAAIWDAIGYLKGGGFVHKDRCRDGKEMWTFAVKGQQWLAIIRGAQIVTLFPTETRYLNWVKERDGCGEGWRLGPHDAPSMAG